MTSLSKRTNARGISAIILALGLTTVLALMTVTNQMAVNQRQKRNAWKALEISSFYTNEMTLWHGHALQQWGIAGLSPNRGNLTQFNNHSTTGITGIISVPVDARAYERDPGTPLNVLTTAKFDHGFNLVEHLVADNLSLRKPQSASPSGTICGVSEWNSEKQRLCASSNWDLPTANLEVSTGAGVWGNGPVTIQAGQTVSLRWSGTVIHSCQLNPGAFTGVTNTVVTAPLNSTTTFTLTCQGPSGVATDTVRVNVNLSPPIVSLRVNGVGAVTIDPNGSPDLSWTSQNATTCSISGLGAVALTGTRRVGPLNANTQYTLTCRNTAGQASASVSITVRDFVRRVEFPPGIVNEFDGDGLVLLNTATGVLSVLPNTEPLPPFRYPYKFAGIGYLNVRVISVRGSVFNAPLTFLSASLGVMSMQLPGTYWPGKGATVVVGPRQRRPGDHGFFSDWIPVYQSTSVGFKFQDGQSFQTGPVSIPGTYWELVQ